MTIACVRVVSQACVLPVDIIIKNNREIVTIACVCVVSRARVLPVDVCGCSVTVTAQYLRSDPLWRPDS